ncbi:hypothetical protein APHAL10511_004383 [Amanita phalloides]|nr:hypothetical protein APHAL10511_004383 [Amanita phalloides]
MGQQASPSSYELSRPLKVLIQTTQEENQIIPVTSLTNCQWGQCDASFSNPAELIGHVNLRHLSPCESPTRTSNDGADSDSELTIPRLQIEDSSINVSNLSCHWRNCNKHPPVPEEPDPHTCSLPYEQWRDLIAVHIFRDHLGLPLDIFAPEVSKDDVEKMNITQNASRNTDPRNSEMDMLTAPSLSPSISSQGSVDVIETPPRDYMDKDPPQSIEMDVDMSLVSNAVNKTTVPNTPHTSSHRCLWLGCNESFKSCEDLTTHLSKVHVGSGRPVYECLWEGCTRNKEAGFGSRQKINRHLQVRVDRH